MEEETKELLEQLKNEIVKSRKPLYISVIQSVAIALIVAVPNFILLLNRFENKLIEQNTIIENHRKMNIKDMEDVNFNFYILQEYLNEHNENDTPIHLKIINTSNYE